MNQSIDLDPLVLLADTSAQKDYADLGVEMEGTDFAAELKELQEEDDKERRKNAAKEVLKLFKAKKASSIKSVENIRRLRQQEAAEKARLKELDRREAYGKATNNFLPLMDLLNLVSWHDKETKGNREMFEIPKDWTPATPAATS